MILAIDIGNSNIVVGLLEGEKTCFVERLATDHKKTELEYAISFKNILELYSIKVSDIEGGIISSVVPPISNTIKASIEKILNKEVKIVGPGLKTGLNIKIDNPAQLGSDRVVDAVAALNSFPVPLIVIDMGTATTISVIDKNRNYIGGVIIPGVKVSLESLSKHTSQLPKISLEAPRKTIGKNTIECMKSGTIFGNASLLDGMISRIEKEIGMKATVVATGGLSKFIVPHCHHEIIQDDNLLLKGLSLIYDKNK
ncbi:MAG: type III pantothenate kinase [Lachnospiraceae bacterium]